MRRARLLLEDLSRQHELLPLEQLANVLHVHLRTLQAASRTGRLETHFTVRSVFGRPRRFATRAAGKKFMATCYRRFSGQQKCAPPLPVVPADYHSQLKSLRCQLGVTQTELALRIGAAGKSVVYQWESRKRTPSPVLWRRVMVLQRAATAPKGAPARCPSRGQTFVVMADESFPSPAGPHLKSKSAEPKTLMSVGLSGVSRYPKKVVLDSHA